jgi:transcriptional regulator with XRE-family HTH domain
MTFREKIDNILRISKKKFSSITELEVAAGLGMNTLRKAYNDDREPSRKVVGKLLEKIGISEGWWDSGKGEIFTEKSTYVEIPTRKEKDPDEHIRILIKNLDRMGELNEYLLKELKRLQGG